VSVVTETTLERDQDREDIRFMMTASQIGSVHRRDRPAEGTVAPSHSCRSESVRQVAGKKRAAGTAGSLAHAETRFGLIPDLSLTAPPLPMTCAAEALAFPPGPSRLTRSASLPDARPDTLRGQRPRSIVPMATPVLGYNSRAREEEGIVRWSDEG
jgi:hypothetical protein